MSDSPDAPVTSRLRAERERQGFSLRDLEHFVGVSHTNLNRLERGLIDVPASVKVRIAKVLRVPVAELWPKEAVEEGAP